MLGTSQRITHQPYTLPCLLHSRAHMYASQRLPCRLLDPAPFCPGSLHTTPMHQTHHPSGTHVRRGVVVAESKSGVELKTWWCCPSQENSKRGEERKQPKRQASLRMRYGSRGNRARPIGQHRMISKKQDTRGEKKTKNTRIPRMPSPKTSTTVTRP